MLGGGETMGRKVRPLQQRDWDQLLVVASGYLALTGGDLKEAMARAIVAHAGLIEAVKHAEVAAELPRGRVVLFVPEEGGLALAFEPHPRRTTPGGADREPAGDAYADLGPPDITLEVHERPSSYDPRQHVARDDAGVHDDEDWSNQGTR
jgi:hypothetical protein